VLRRTARWLASGTLLAALGGCGFLGAAGVSHAKPDAFVLRGQVTVPVPGSDTRPTGAACAAGIPGIVAGAPVTVTGPDGKVLGTGRLGAGVIARTGTGVGCDYPFQVPAVPGGVDSYDVAVGTHSQRFPAKPLRENASAILTVTGS
jgi:hypothetical protein